MTNAGASADFETVFPPPPHPQKKNQGQTRRCISRQLSSPRLSQVSVQLESKTDRKLLTRRRPCWQITSAALTALSPILFMIIRQRGTSSLWLLLLLISAASAQLNADCHLSVGDDRYDFSALQGDHTVSRSRSLPPTNMTDTLRFNVCKELSLLEGVVSGDQVRIRYILKSALTYDLCSVAAGRGRVLVRQTSNKESRTELLQLFLLPRSQSCGQNTPSCLVRSSPPWLLGAR